MSADVTGRTVPALGFRPPRDIGRVSTCLALARKAQRERPSIDGDDVLAWALARNGRCADALRYSKLALRLGTKDALKFFHRGWIAACLGDAAEDDE